MKEFVLPFYGLKPGTHTYNFEIGNSFFSAFENTLIEDADFDVTLKLEKLTNMLVLNFKGKGKVNDFCDRCGDPLVLKCKVKDEIIVKFGDADYEQVDEVLVLSHDTHEIDVAPLIYEMIVLNLPRKKVHKSTADCNSEVLERLKTAEKSDDNNKETDPRWEALKKLK